MWRMTWQALSVGPYPCPGSTFSIAKRERAIGAPRTRGLHSSTLQLNLSRSSH
jgi:hypothetical protein